MLVQRLLLPFPGLAGNEADAVDARQDPVIHADQRRMARHLRNGLMDQLVLVQAGRVPGRAALQARLAGLAATSASNDRPQSWLGGTRRHAMQPGRGKGPCFMHGETLGRILPKNPNIVYLILYAKLWRIDVGFFVFPVARCGKVDCPKAWRTSADGLIKNAERAPGPACDVFLEPLRRAPIVLPGCGAHRRFRRSALAPAPAATWRECRVSAAWRH